MQKSQDHKTQKFRQSGNPFTRMTGVDPIYLGGRKNELEFFDQHLDRVTHSKFREHFLVLGDWGIGKSTLLREYKRICQNKGSLAALVPLEPLQPGTKLIEAARCIVEGILRDLPYPLNKFKKVSELFNSFGINILGSGLQFSRSSSKNDYSPQSFLHDTLLRLWQDLEDKTEILVILLDDLDNFIVVPEIVMSLKQALSLDSIKKTKILFGLSLPLSSWLEITSKKKHHPLSRYFISRIDLTPLDEKELSETIQTTLNSTNVSFSYEVIKQVFEHTKGHPFEMQVLCYHLFNNQILGKVEIDVFEKALLATLGDLGIAVFDYMYKLASNEESKVLHALAISGIPVAIKDIPKILESRQQSISSSNIAKYLERLVEKGLVIKKDRGLYFISDRMFREYLQNQLD